MSNIARAVTWVGRYFQCLSIAALVAGCGGGSTDNSVPATQPAAIAQNDPGPANTDAAPTITGLPSSTAVVGTAYSFQPSASDADGDSLTFLIENKPSWATFDASSGLLSGVPTAADVGTTPAIKISVSDAKAEAELPPFQIQVTADPPPPDSPPTISGQPGVSAVVGSHYVFQPSASDPNGDRLTFSITGKPGWAAFNTANGQLSGTPASADIGTDANIVVTVSDGQRTASLPAFTINVTAAANHPPTISGSPPTTGTVGASYKFQPSAADADGDTLTFKISNKPTWASFDTTSGMLSGAPTSSDAGKSTSGIVISVSDGKATASLASFAISVVAAPVNPPPNSPPTISGQPATTVQAGTQYSFQPSASDANGDRLTFVITNLPSWATFNSQTGQLTGKPAIANVGTFANIEISVSDGKASAALPAFSIKVTAPANHPPTISGTPSTQVQVGQAYSFTPQAADADADKLTFSVQNKPSWASFDTSTGTLSGTPSGANAGTFANIVISVSDGKASTPLPGFSITVKAPTTGTALVKWAAPSSNTDGTPITDLSGYVIQYGSSPTALAQRVMIQDPSVTSYSLTGLGSGVWYFAVSSYNSSGAQSALSNVASKTIP